MSSRLGLVHRYCIHRNSIYIHHHTLHTRSIHSNSLLYIQPIHRFTTKPLNNNKNGNGTPGKPKPNYMLRILFVSSIIAGSTIYYNGWTDNIISFTKQRFSYLKHDKDKKSSGNVYKLPKPKQTHIQTSKPKDHKIKHKKDALPKHKPKPKPRHKPIVITPPITIPPPIPPQPIAPPKQQPEIKQEPNPIKETIKILKEETKEISQELIQKYEEIKQEYERLKQETKEKQEKEIVTQYVKVELDETEKETFKKEITTLKNIIDKRELRIEELERDLNEKNEFLSENLKNLEEGRKAYDEIAQIFEEMRIEYSENMISQMENMENERRNRLNKLRNLSVDIRVIEKIMNWYDINNKFFLHLAELNNIIYKFEYKINNGLSYDNELKYLLNNLPQHFISYNLLNNLNKSQNKNKQFHIHSHQQLYDRFCVLENALRETAMTPKSTNSLWGNVLAKIFSFILFREQISRSGTSFNDRISRAGYSMKLGDLDSTLNELNYLDENILYPAQDWLKCARQRLLGLYVIKMLKSELLSRSVKMVDNE